jgi:hypothetical protein
LKLFRVPFCRTNVQKIEFSQGKRCHNSSSFTISGATGGKLENSFHQNVKLLLKVLSSVLISATFRSFQQATCELEIHPEVPRELPGHITLGSK